MNTVEHRIVIRDPNGVNEDVDLSFTTSTNEDSYHYSLGFRFRNKYKLIRELDKFKEKFIVDWWFETDEERRMIYTNKGDFHDAFDRLSVWGVPL